MACNLAWDERFIFPDGTDCFDIGVLGIYWSDTESNRRRILSLIRREHPGIDNGFEFTRQEEIELLKGYVMPSSKEDGYWKYFEKSNPATIPITYVKVKE